MSTKIVRNTTDSLISITDTGVSLEPNESFTIDARNYGEWAQSTVKTSYINSGAIVVNDGSRDLAASVGLGYLNDNIAFKITFESPPERGNNFTSKNVQQAIEEARDAIQGKLSTVAFFNNGATSNKWLVFFSSSDPSNSNPMISLGESALIGASYVNIMDNSDIDLEVYKNGSLILTWAIRNKRWAYSVGSFASNTWGLGDRCSVFAKKVNGGSGVNPNSVILRLMFQATGNSTGSGGAQSGV